MNTGHKISWKKYIEKTSSNGVRPLLVEALRHVPHKGEALDIGAGALNDSKHLLSVGFIHVTAVDADETAREIAVTIKDERFSFVQAGYEDLVLEKEKYDVVTAQYALPFCEPLTFGVLIPDIIASLKPCGIFTGQLFGERDGWNTVDSGKTFHTSDKARKLFDGMDLIKFEEEERDGETALGKPKHWHVFHFIARK